MTEAAVFGLSVHRGVEFLLRSLKASGATSMADERATATLRSLGGFSAVAEEALANVLLGLEPNPRMVQYVNRLRKRLRQRVPEMRRVIQTLISRTTLTRGPTSVASDGQGSGRRGRRLPGPHLEAALTADAERFTGRLDLLTVHETAAEIVDYKSGQRSDRHDRQLRRYGLLWLLDESANPNRLPVLSLTLAYVDADVSVPLPGDWDTVREALVEEISRADLSVEETPPKAIPSPDCRWCSVRHLCNDYWVSEVGQELQFGSLGDIEVEIVMRNGPRSWVSRTIPGSRPALLRTTSDGETFEPGQRLRALDIAVTEPEGGDQGDDEGWLVITTVGSSEIHRLLA